MTDGLATKCGSGGGLSGCCQVLPTQCVERRGDINQQTLAAAGHRDRHRRRISHRKSLTCAAASRMRLKRSPTSTAATTSPSGYRSQQPLCRLKPA